MAKRERAVLRYDLEGTLGDSLFFAVTWKDSSMLITQVAHDKTSNDINSLWTTGEGVVIVLSAIVDVDTLRFYRYEAIDPPVDIATTGTITHTYGATNTTDVVYTGAYFNLPVDLTAGIGIGQIKLEKTDTTAIATFTVTLGNLVSNIKWELDEAISETLTPNIKYYYDIEITAGGNVRTYIEGTLKLSQDTTRTV